MPPDIHPLVLESILELLLQEGAIVVQEAVNIRAGDVTPQEQSLVQKVLCTVCGVNNNPACGGDDKVVLLSKILARVHTLGFGRGYYEPYRPGDNAADVERKILQVICRA